MLSFRLLPFLTIRLNTSISLDPRISFSAASEHRFTLSLSILTVASVWMVMSLDLVFMEKPAPLAVWISILSYLGREILLPLL